MSQDYEDIQGSDLLADSPAKLNSTADALRTGFAGSGEPSNPVPYQLWKDLTTGWVRERNAANDAWIAICRIGVADGGMLAKSGGTMEGPVDMGGYALTNLGLGTGLAAARAQELALKADIAGPQFTGDAQVNQDPAGANSIIRRSWADARYVAKAGDTLTGPLVLAGNATADLHAIGLKQVRDLASFNLASGHHHDGVNSRRTRGAALDSDGASATKFLRSDGTGLAIWWTARRFVLLPAVTIVDWTAAHAWTSVNIGSYIEGQVSDLGAYAAILQLAIPPSVTVEFRPDALSGIDQSWSQGTLATSLLNLMTVVRLDATGGPFLHLRDTRGASSEHMYVKLLGVLEA